MFTVDNLSDSSFVRACISEKYTNFRVINQRRIDIHTMSVLNICVYDCIKYPTLCSCENSKLKSDKIEISNVLASYVDKIDFDEDFSLPSESKPVGRIISASYYPTITDTKIIKDKVLIKANVNVSVLYSADTDENELEKTSYSFSVSKIIDRSGIDDGDILIADASIGSIFFKVKGSANEKVSVINVYGDVALNLVFIRREEIDVISDGYMLGAKSECKYSDVPAYIDGRLISDNKLINIPLEFNSEINQIYELSLKLSAVSYNEGTIKGEVQATAIVDSDGGITSLGTSSDFKIVIDKYDDAVVSLDIESFDYTLADSGRVDLRLNLIINAFCFNKVTLPLLEDMNVTQQVDDKHTLTVYFGKENERIWDIAKDFLADENDIKTENSLSGEALESAQVLIIPKA